MTLEQRRALAMASARLRLQEQGQSQDEPAFEREAKETLSVTTPELISANPTVRMLTAAGRPVLGAAGLVEGLWGGTSNVDRLKQLDTMQKRGNAALGFGGAGMAADISGSILSPITAAATKIPAAATYFGKVAQGAGVGAGAGLTAGTDKPIQAGAEGAAFGGFLTAIAPLVAKGGSAAYHALIEPWFNPAAIKGRAFLEAAGDKADEIIKLLRQNKELVPGSAPTAGEAAVPAGRAEFAALQRSASNVKPSDYQARIDAQNAARLAAVKGVGQDEAALKAASATRAQNAEASYGAIRDDLIVPADARINALLERPSMAKAVERAKELAAERGGTFPAAKGAVSVGNMQDVKMALDDMTKNPERFGIGASEVSAINRTRAEFIMWLNKQSPAWEKARLQYAAESKPINQMEIGQYLEKKLVPALSDDAKQKAATYASALQDAPGTIKKATGAPRYEKLTEVLTPDQLAAVNSVRDDLARSARFEQLASKGSQAAPDAVKLATRSMEQVAGPVRLGILERTAMIANSIIQRAEGKINKRLAAEIASEMLNPPVVAESLAQAKIREVKNKMLAKAVENMKLPAVAVGAQFMEAQQ